MELPLKVASKCELRGVIRFLTGKNKTATEIHQELCSVYGQQCMSLQMVARWRTQFVNGRDQLHDEERAGRPAHATTDENVALVKQLIDEDPRYTLDELTLRLPSRGECSRSSIRTIIHDVLGLRKVSARWVPRLLSDQHKTNRMGAALSLLTAYEEEGDSLLRRVVTGDETWVYHYMPQSKRSSMEWVEKGGRPPKKCKTTFSACKVLATVFWDYRGVLLIDYLQHGRTINAAYYCDLLDRLRVAIKNKRPGLLSEKVFFIHDNARPHSARITQEKLQKFKWQVFEHPPYSPDLAPSDYHLFPKLKETFGGVRFNSTEEIEDAVTDYFKKLDASHYRLGIDKLIVRYEKCLERFGDYVEK